MSKPAESTCSECGPLSCYRQEKTYPPFCLTEAADEQQVASVVELLRGDNPDGRMARAAAEIEGLYYGKATRVEEIDSLCQAHRRATHRRRYLPGTDRRGAHLCKGSTGQRLGALYRCLQSRLRRQARDWRSRRSAPAKRRVRGNVQSGSAGAIAQCKKDRAQCAGWPLCRAR